ncbi:beta-lactam-binding protein with PASTA domain [Allocatelliglobosispora scoriae]|uniref:Beta-lactam-binding protein with PASTA domain n=1 Tax=Allocatelliglobosispora scoriae TaxID=643052 RepID=A0A841BE44_9ACTN|nr:Stk1 family PASTA domain-containing Ser/Thr kinase [Allocatelliglobosispora scoriae]MBB5867367.1 beta-lactam-binding protein with PASTA domain [Allocatelliglobosispora scoriae]
MSDLLTSWLPAHRLLRAALAIVAVAGAGAAVFTVGYQRSDSALGDGSAYLQKQHSVVHINGASGDIDAESAKTLATGTQQLEVVQVRPGVVYAVNNDTGEVTLLPTDTMEPEPVDKRPESSGRLTVESGGDNAYLVDAVRGTASRLDGLGGPGSDVPLPAKIDQMVVDGGGVGWGYAPDSGELFRVVDGKVDGRQRVGGLGEHVVLTLVGGRPVVYRPATGQAEVYDADGLVRRLDLAADNGLIADESTQDTLVVFVPRTGELVVADADGEIRRTVIGDRKGEQSRFGRPVVFQGRAYLPDYTYHHIIAVDLAGPRVVLTEPVPGTARPFHVMVRDNLLWVSDPYDRTIMTFDKRGVKTEGEPGEPAASPSAKPSPTPSPTASAAAPGSGSPSPSPTVRTIVVPNVVGSDRNEACRRLRPLTCRLVAVPEGNGETGAVLSTKPPAGSRVKPTSRITVYYRGPAEVPNLANMTADEACDAVRQAKLTCVERKEGTAATAAAAFVVTAQQPAPGTRIDTGGNVTITYPVTVAVPAVVGTPIDQACTTLESATYGFHCARNDLGSAAGTGQQPGVAVRQAPDGNTAAAPGTTVTVSFYGNANTTVPAVTGIGPDDACARLAAAFLTCNRQDYAATNQLGVVLAQSHPGGAVLPAGTAVTIVYETTGAVTLLRWKAPAPRRANFLAPAGSGQGPPGGWSAQSSFASVYQPGTADLPGLVPIFRSRCVSGCGEIGGYYLSGNGAAQAGYAMEGEAFRCFDPAAAPAGTRDLHALFLDDANTWVAAVPGTGEWNVFHQSPIRYDFVICNVW